MVLAAIMVGCAATVLALMALFEPLRPPGVPWCCPKHLVAAMAIALAVGAFVLAGLALHCR